MERRRGRSWGLLSAARMRGLGAMESICLFARLLKGFLRSCHDEAVTCTWLGGRQSCGYGGYDDQVC